MPPTSGPNTEIPDFLRTDPEGIRRQLSTREGWLQFVQSNPRTPGRKSPDEYAALSESDKRVYDAARIELHRSGRLIRHAQLNEAWQQIDAIVAGASSDRGPGRGIALTGGPGFGKTSIAVGWGRHYERNLRDQYPAAFQQEDVVVPVCYSSFLPRSGLKANLERILGFYGERVSKRETGAQMLDRLCEVTYDCRTQVIILDQAQNLRSSDKRDNEVAAHLKHLMDDANGALMLVGINLATQGPLAPSVNDTSGDREQLARRFAPIEIQELGARSSQWRSLMSVLERSVLLINARDGDLSRLCSELLWERSSGAIGVAIGLVSTSANLAIQNGQERLTPELLEESADTIAHRARDEWY